MKKKSIVLLIVICMMSLLFVGCSLFENEDKKVNNPLDEHQKQEQKEDVNEYIKTEDDGTRVNTSDKIKNAKFTIDGLEISNIQLSELVGKTSLVADVKNNTQEKKGDIELLITLYKKDGSVLLEMGGYIGTVEAGATSKIDAAATLDYANAYDIKIEKR